MDTTHDRSLEFIEHMAVRVDVPRSMHVMQGKGPRYRPYMLLRTT